MDAAGLGFWETYLITGEITRKAICTRPTAKQANTYLQTHQPHGVIR